MDVRFPEPKSTRFLRPEFPRHPWPRVGLLRSRPDLVPQLRNSRFLPATVHDNPGHLGARHRRPRVGSPGFGYTARGRSDRQIRFAAEGTSPPLLSHLFRSRRYISTQWQTKLQTITQTKTFWG